MLSKSTFSKSKTLGQVPGEMTCSSGYIADASSARTPGLFLQATQRQDKAKQHTDAIVALNEKEEEDEEPTGFFGIMSEFQKGAGLLPPSNSVSQSNTSKTLLKGNESMQGGFNQSVSRQNITDISRLAGGEATPSRSIMQLSLKASLLGDSMIHDNSVFTPRVLDEMPGPDLELTQYSPEKVGVSYNPLDSSIHRKLLTDLKVPVAQRHGYYRIDANLPHIRPHQIIQVGPTTFIVKECKGNYNLLLLFICD